MQEHGLSYKRSFDGTKPILLGLTVLGFFLVGWSASAKEQVATPTVTSQTVTAGGVVSLTVQYSTANPADALSPGLGVRVHFDSSKLTFTGFSNVYQSGSTLVDATSSGLIGQDTVPVADSTNGDKDAATDKMVGLAWVSLGGTWPASGSGPINLFTVNFTAATPFSTPAAVHLVASSTAVGYTFASANALLLPAGLTYAILDVDHSGATDATDGVLILRRLNAASTIDTGVVLPAGQTNGTVVGTIDATGFALDVDKSGAIDASDGVLVLRRLNAASTINTGLVLPSGQTNASVLSTIDALK